MQIKTKEDRRDRIKYRIRKKMAGTSDELPGPPAVRT